MARNPAEEPTDRGIFTLYASRPALSVRRRTLAPPAFALGRGGRAGRFHGLKEVEATEKDESEAETATGGAELQLRASRTVVLQRLIRGEG